MIYLKSALAGAVAVVAALLLTALIMIVTLTVESRNLPGGQTIGWDPVTFYRNSGLAWITLALAFLIGFVWEYRRVSRGY